MEVRLSSLSLSLTFLRFSYQRCFKLHLLLHTNSTWQTCGDEACSHDACTEMETIEVAERMRSDGWKELGYDHILLDDCWVAQSRGVNETLTWDETRFPSGMPEFIDTLHEMDFKVGLYTSLGSTTCTGRPGSRYHYDQDARTFASWSVDYLKLDWCGDIKDQVWMGKQAHRDFKCAMDATNASIFLETVAGFLFLRDEISQVADSFRFCTDHHDNFKSTYDQILCRDDLALLDPHEDKAWPSMDFLMTGGAGCANASHCPGQSDGEYRIEFVIWSLTQSPLVIATDLRNVTSIMSVVLRNEELLNLYQDTSIAPGGKISTWLCSEVSACHVWGRLALSNGTKWIVALTNTGSKSHNITVNFDELGQWNSTTSAIVRHVELTPTLTRSEDDGIDNEVVRGSFTATVPSHDVVVVSLTAAGML